MKRKRKKTISETQWDWSPNKSSYCIFPIWFLFPHAFSVFWGWSGCHNIDELRGKKRPEGDWTSWYLMINSIFFSFLSFSKKDVSLNLSLSFDCRYKGCSSLCSGRQIVFFIIESMGRKSVETGEGLKTHLSFFDHNFFKWKWNLIKIWGIVEDYLRFVFAKICSEKLSGS